MARRRLLVIIGTIAALAALPATAAETGPATPAAPPTQASPICVNAGNHYKIGDYACIPGCHGRQRYARCDALAQTASWTFISEVCPVALVAPPAPEAATLAPVTTAMTPIPFVIAMSAIDPEIAERIAGR